MVGAGQLARMTHQAAISLGQSLRVLAESADAAAALIAGSVVVGDYRSSRIFGRSRPAATWSPSTTSMCRTSTSRCSGGRRGPPVGGCRAVRAGQGADARAPRGPGVSGPAVDRADRVAGSSRCVGRVRRGGRLAGRAENASGGYDGKGVWLLDSPEAAARLLATGARLLAEARVPIARELAAVVARSPYGQGGTWPVVETVQREASASR